MAFDNKKPDNPGKSRDKQPEKAKKAFKEGNRDDTGRLDEEKKELPKREGQGDSSGGRRGE